MISKWTGEYVNHQRATLTESNEQQKQQMQKVIKKQSDRELSLNNLRVAFFNSKKQVYQNTAKPQFKIFDSADCKQRKARPKRETFVRLKSCDKATCYGFVIR